MNENNKKEYIKISKKKLVKVVAGAAIVGTLVANATGLIFEFAETAHQRDIGAGAIAREINESGIYPEHLNVREDSQAGYIINYEDIDGNRINVVDTEAFINDIVVEAIDDHGFSPNEIAVALEYNFGYDGKQIEGATKEGMNDAKMAAYHQEMHDKLSGRGM